jgi:uncharacterized membrane protein
MTTEWHMATRASQGVRVLLWAPVVLSGLGIYVSGYLVTKRFTGGSLACTRWAQCDVVNNSVYSQLYGVPVCVIGLGGYLLLLVLALAALWTDGRTRSRLLVASLLLSLGGVGFSIYLTYLEIYVIEALCAWCIASAVIIALLLVTNAIAAWQSSPAASGARAHG